MVSCLDIHYPAAMTVSGLVGAVGPVTGSVGSDRMTLTPNSPFQSSGIWNLETGTLIFSLASCATLDNAEALYPNGGIRYCYSMLAGTEQVKYLTALSLFSAPCIFE
jgi:hypothetical protein